MKPLNFLLTIDLLLLACSSGPQVNLYTGKMIHPGRGVEGLTIGMAADKILSALGEPQIINEDNTWLDYTQDLGLAFHLDNLQNVSEIHFQPGFVGRLPSRVQIGSKSLDVFNAYGSPTERKEVTSESDGIEDRVLYKSPSGYKITYNRLGLVFWFSPVKRVTRIVVFHPLPDRGIRIKPEGIGE